MAPPVKPRVGGSENVLVHDDPDGDCSKCYDDDNCQRIPAEMEPPVQQSQNLRISNSQSILYQPLQPVTLKVQ
jgi:hypothetical protein